MLRHTISQTLRLCHHAGSAIAESTVNRSAVQCHLPSLTVLNSQILRNYASSENADKFSGVIPMDELSFKYSRSSGAGGQHVNKVNTKVELRFNLDSAKWIPDKIKETLQEKHRGSITKDGDFIVKSEKTRVQMMNKADALEKLRDMIFKAGEEERVEPTEEDIKNKQEKLDKANEIRLQQKKTLSLKKQYRGGPRLNEL